MANDALRVTAQLHPWLAEELEGLFFREMRRGERRKLPDGRIRLRFELEGLQAEIWRMLMRELMRTPSRHVRIKYMGLEINPN